MLSESWGRLGKWKKLLKFSTNLQNHLHYSCPPCKQYEPPCIPRLVGQSLFTLIEYTAIDDILNSFASPLNIIEYISNKLLKCGINIVALDMPNSVVLTISKYIEEDSPMGRLLFEIPHQILWGVF